MKHDNLSVVLGPPGTGKTTRLLSIMQTEVEAGVQQEQVACVAFTKKAATEATERAQIIFGTRLPHISTLHSLAYHHLGMRKDGTMNWKHRRELADLLGIELRGSRSNDDDFYGMKAGDRLIHLEELARHRQCPLRTVWEEANESDIDYRELARYAEALTIYKRRNGLRDFTDFVSDFVQGGSVPLFDVLIVDEAQDLTALEWRMTELIAAKAKRVYIAGDDDQAIYRWKGADVDQFMALNGKVTVLDQSWRVPYKVHVLAERILRRMSRRTPKVYKPRPERGSFNWYSDAGEVDLSEGPGWKEYRQANPNAVEWLLLARNGYMLRNLEQMCMRQGFSFTSVDHNPLESKALKAIITYTRLCRNIPASKEEVRNVLMHIKHLHIDLKRCKTEQVGLADLQKLGFFKEPPIWHKALDKITDSDREFFIAARRRGETLTGTPRIRISTIHTAKGGEADNVLLLTGMSQRTYQEMDRRMDDELRVWYVAVTRARKGLHVVQQHAGDSFDL